MTVLTARQKLPTYGALEEILVNAVFHKSYRIQEPVEIRIYLDCIKVINYPGPEKLINIDELKAGRAIARRYRNRRIGEFLKEIDLSEKKSTGITKILRTLKANGSPLPDFKTDNERNYMIVSMRPHEAFKQNEEINEEINGITTNRQKQILNAIKEKSDITLKQLVELTGITKITIERELKALMNNGAIKRIGSRKSGYWELREHNQ